jgi:hypothetical protein
MIDRTELVFYDISNDEIIEMSRIENEFGFCSVDDKNKYIKIWKCDIISISLFNINNFIMKK